MPNHERAQGWPAWSTLHRKLENDSRMLAVSRERVAQIEASALRKLKRWC